MRKWLPKILIVAGILIFGFSIAPIVAGEIWYQWKQIRGQEYFLYSGDQNSEDSVFAKFLENSTTDSVFARFLSNRPVRLDPVNTDFALVIEKIGVNAPIVQDVSVTNEQAYLNALKNGVAHASLSRYPSEEPGNVYLFAHASLNFWQLGEYAMVFNLIRKLEPGDKIHVFYQGKQYIYETANKEVLEGWNTYPLTRPTIEPTLTLQTCDPPGTTLNRMVVTATLVEVREL